jgi:Outer membrane protein beta-barrel domain
VIRDLGLRAAMVALVFAVAAVWSTAAAAASDQWAKGAQWMSIRAGASRNSGDQAYDGGAGYGFGYSRMLNKRWAIGFYAHHELLSKSGGAAEMEFPFTAELVRHFRLSPDLRPYFGIGGGGFNYRTFRSGDDRIRPATGYYVVGGANTPLDPHQLLGLDVRFVRLNGKEDLVNPTFGRQKSTFYSLGIKLNWSFVY